MQNTNTLFDQLDVRSMRLLKYLLESRNVSKTADYIGLSQPATSRIVAKLRKMFNDPLLVRVDTGYGLTPHAVQLYQKLIIALESINAVMEAGEFDIANIKATIRVASTDYGILCVLRHLYPVLLEQAPGINLEINSFTPLAFSSIEHGELDLAFFADFDMPGGFHYRTLFEEDYSVLVRRDHPLLEQTKDGLPINQELLEGWPRAEILFPSMHQMKNDAVINTEAVSEHSHINFRLPYFLATVPLIECTDTLVALPTRICRHAERHYAVKALPIAEEDKFTYLVIWHHRQHQRPLLRWIVNQLAEIFSDKNSKTTVASD